MVNYWMVFVVIARVSLVFAILLVYFETKLALSLQLNQYVTPIPHEKTHPDSGFCETPSLIPLIDSLKMLSYKPSFVFLVYMTSFVFCFSPIASLFAFCTIVWLLAIQIGRNTREIPHYSHTRRHQFN